ncbi:MAG: hypothetical protein HUJ25_12480 [Crocinitomicaceae bacterium]|nr:hypothetical protein [Crocinitomicaceae bacterium]
MEEMETDNNGHLEVERKSNGSQLFTEPYSAENIERIKSMLENFHNIGEKKYYSVHVDGETVVARTCDARKFNGYLPFLNKHTKKVEVKLYSGYSPKCNTYLFYLHNALSGVPQNNVDVQGEIKKALDKQKLEFELEQLKSKLKEKSKKIEKLEEVIEGHSKWTPENVNSAINQGIQALSQITLLRKGGSLQGAPAAHNQPQSEVHVEVQADEDDEEYSETREFFEEMLEEHGEETMKNAIGWMSVLAAYPHLQKKLKKELDKINEESPSGDSEDGKEDEDEA